jgi:hypothetical protein
VIKENETAEAEFKITSQQEETEPKENTEEDNVKPIQGEDEGSKVCLALDIHFSSFFERVCSPHSWPFHSSQ